MIIRDWENSLKWREKVIPIGDKIGKLKTNFKSKSSNSSLYRHKIQRSAPRAQTSRVLRVFVLHAKRAWLASTLRFGSFDCFSSLHLLRLLSLPTRHCGFYPYPFPSRSPSLLSILATTTRPVKASSASHVVLDSAPLCHEVTGGRRLCGVGLKLGHEVTRRLGAIHI